MQSNNTTVVPLFIASFWSSCIAAYCFDRYMYSYCIGQSLCTCTCLSSANSSLQETKVIQNVNLFCLSSTPRKYTIYVSINSVFNVVNAKTAKTRTFNDLFAFKFTLDVNITTRVIRSIKQGTKGPQTFKLTNYDHWLIVFEENQLQISQQPI